MLRSRLYAIMHISDMSEDNIPLFVIPPGRLSMLLCNSRLSTYGSTTLLLDLGRFSVSWASTQSVGLLGRGISPTWTHRTAQTQNGTHTGIHASCGIRTYNPSVWAGEDSSSLHPRGHCDQQFKVVLEDKINSSVKLSGRLYTVIHFYIMFFF
jgi:hypothetical protein